jgi:superfamily II DNA or RNA helicase
MADKNAQKSVILLSPQRLLTDHIVLESLLIQKKNGSVDYVIKELTNTEVGRHFSDLPKHAKNILIWFCKEGVDAMVSKIKKKHALQRAGIAYDVYFRAAILRDIHDSFETLKPFAVLIKWYQKVKTETGNYRVSPVVFSKYRPILQFEVVQQSEGLYLETSIVLNGTPFPLSSFNRYSFLLESNNEYFLLGYKDFQTLEWLVANDPAQYALQPALLAQNILAKLEEDYTVNRNGLFSENTIEVAPVNRVMLSEISGSFLVLTPQWMYEGFLIEGEWKEIYETTKQGEVYVVKRNKEAEHAFVQSLIALHPNFSRQVNGYFYLSFADAQKKQWFLKVYHQLLEQNIQVVGMDMLQHFRYSSFKPTTTIKIPDSKENSLLIELSLLFGKEEVPLPELQKMLLAGQKAILLKDGSLGVLGEEWLQQYGTIIKHGKIEGKALRVARWMAINEQASEQDAEVLKPVLKREWWQKWQQWQQPDTLVYNIPKHISATLRPYQQKGFEWMMLLSEAGAGACLADDMGLGKTLQTICLLAYKLELQPATKHLIVCPTSLIYNWVQELQKFAPHLKSLVYHGAQRQFEELETSDYHIAITSYGTLRSDIEKMASLSFDVAVIDESHNIKNPSALITRAVNQVNAVSRVALSGTPVMNNTFDLYAQLSFLLPGMFGSREFFKREYADAIDRDRDPDKIKALQKLTSPFILRRTKEQVATDLPEKVETILWCSMGTDQKAAYESIKEKVRSSIFIEIKEKGLNSGKLSVINGLLKLRQVCNSAELVKDEDLFTYDSIKTDILVEELQNIIGSHKALVFSQFTSMLDLLEKRLIAHRISFCRLDGSTPMADRQELVNRFQNEGSKEKVFLISLKAGNAGLNLTAADYVFLFDPWWNTAVQQQAIDRTHRIGQTKNVFAYKMICKGTIEEKIIQLQQRKKKLSDELIGEEDGFVKSLDEQDIEFLFS